MTPALAATFLAAAIVAPFPADAAAEPVVILPFKHLAAVEAPRARGHDADGFDRDFTHELHGAIGTMFGPKLGGKVVTGAPYSAEVVTETHQTLADGNVITRKSSSHVYRDGEGRTRQEAGGDGKARRVFINDPVEKRHYVLVPDAKRAVETRVSPRARVFETRDRQVVRIGPTEVRIEDGKVTVNGKEVKVRDLDLEVAGKKIRIENGRVTIDGKDVGEGRRSVEVRTLDRDETPDGTRREEIRVQVIRAGEEDITVLAPVAPAPPVPPVPPVPGFAPLAPLPPMPGVQTFRFESTARLGPGVTTSLGTKEFDGVRAEGKSTTWTIPAGRIGNSNPIHVVSETWYSPDLQVTVYSRHSDPRTGESIYRLAGVRRGEPDPQLFRVPEDYRVKSRARG